MPTPQPSVKVPGPRHAKQRRSAITRVLQWTFLLLLAGVIVAGVAGFFAYGEYASPGPLAEDKVFMVEPGQSASQIGETLARNGIVSNGRLFALMAQLTGQRGRLKAGEYAFPKGATMADVIALIASGKAVTYKISVPEGFTSQMTVDRVNANEVLTGDPATVPPEGSILPDTYVFRRGMTRQKLVEDMQAAQKKLLDELWAARKPVAVIATPEQAVTLASIAPECSGYVPDARASTVAWQREFQSAGVETELLDARHGLALHGRRQGRLLRHQPQVAPVMGGQDQPAFVATVLEHPVFLAHQSAEEGHLEFGVGDRVGDAGVGLPFRERSVGRALVAGLDDCEAVSGAGPVRGAGLAAALDHVGQARDLVPTAHHLGQFDVGDRRGGGLSESRAGGGERRGGGQDRDQAFEHQDVNSGVS